MTSNLSLLVVLLVVAVFGALGIWVVRFVLFHSFLPGGMPSDWVGSWQFLWALFGALGLIASPFVLLTVVAAGDRLEFRSVYTWLAHKLLLLTLAGIPWLLLGWVRKWF